MAWKNVLEAMAQAIATLKIKVCLIGAVSMAGSLLEHDLKSGTVGCLPNIVMEIKH
jgi:hypothetical protein